MEGLKEKAVKGVSWTLAEKFGIQGIRFILNIILARMLTPEAFGLIGMIIVFFAIAQVMIEGGLGQAYVQKKNVTKADASTIFYVNLVVSLLLYVILFFAAPLIARFYERNELILLIRVMGVIIVINAFQVLQIATITRNFNFKRKTKILLFSTLLAGFLGITSAYYDFGVWALVIMNLSTAFFSVVGLWITSSWKPDRIFSVDSFKELFSFGGWLLFAGMISKLFDNIYILAIGKFFPLAQVGFYTQAKKIRQLSSEQVAGAIGIVAFPLFSKLQADKTKLKMAMRNFLQHTLFFLAPAMVLLIVIAKPFVILVLTGKWAPMIPYMQLLCFAGILYPIHLVNVQVLIAQGKSRLNFGLDVLKNTLRIINIVITFRFGVIFIIIGEVILSIIALLINTYYTNKFVGYSILNQLKDVYKILIISFFVGMIVYFAFSSIENYWLLLFGQTILFGCIYIGLSYFIDRMFFKEILDLKKYFVKKV